MNLQQRISAFVSLGQYLYTASQQSDTDAEIDLLQLFNRAKFKNPWYSTDNIKLAFLNHSQLLTKENLSAAVQNFPCPENTDKCIAAVLTDRIPLECFSDIVCILLTGNHAIVRPTEKDFVTWFVLKKLKEIEPEFADYIEIDDAILHPFDAIIAENTNELFARYATKRPNLLRDEKTSIAVLDGTENAEELSKLGKDIFNFYGLSTKNVSKIFVPEDFEITRIFEAVEPFNTVSMHFKYMNNYEYNKSIYLISRLEHLDNGFLILKNDSGLKSPVAVVFYEKYSDISQVQKIVQENRNKIKNIISNKAALLPDAIPFGTATEIQKNELTETLNFLTHLTI